ncbi:MAG: DUF1385 domain-containing protein [Bacillota bacterium]|nr:DUF1385 domain-containing protein [Bacillota bacterium]
MNKEKTHKTSIGGQAVLEGVMMRGPAKIAVAVRKSSGEIVTDIQDIKPVSKRNKFLRMPIVRGCIAFFESLIVGIRTLMLSADMYDIEEDENEGNKESKIDEFIEKIFKNKDAVIYFSVVVALIFSVGLFFVIPGVIFNLLAKVIENRMVLNLIEGIIRIAIFLSYLALVSMNKDIQRVFEYHGAEHKTIYAYEHGEELIPENVRKYQRLHPRCGTSFLLFIMIISILVFSLIPKEVGGMPVNGFTIIFIKLLLLPLISGISYEIIKWAGRSDGKFVMALSKPGMMLQYLTTKEPDDSQLEVAIESMKAVIPENREDDKW